MAILSACARASDPTSGAGGTPGAAGGADGSGSGGRGSGGTSGGGTGGRTGAGGGSAGGSSGGGTGGASSGGTGGGTAGSSGGGCASLPLCDTFETTAVGSPPSASLWTLIPSSPGGTATIDSIGAHGSARSLKVASNDRLYLRNSTVIGGLGPVVHVRFFARFMTALSANHGALVVTHPVPVDQYTQQPELRFGSQDMVFHWNTDTDAANLPDVSPNGDAASFKPAANTWYCIELTINSGNGHLNASIDGTDVPGLTADGVGTPNIDQAWVASAPSLARYTAFADFNIGWQSYGAGPLTVWFDDIALASAPIGCQN